MNVLKIIKINLLALLAFPLLLVATVVKLIAKAMEKILLIIGTVLVLGVLVLALEVLKEPGNILTGIAYLIAIMILGGIVIALIIWILSLISSIAIAFVELIINVINAVYELIYMGYAGLYHICYEDYCTLEMSPGGKRGSCFIFTCLRIINRIIVFFATHALKVLAVITVAVVVYCVARSNAYINNVFGMSLIAYLKLFSVFEVIAGIIIYVAVLAAFAIVMLSLGVEWSEWGEEMSLNTSDYEKQVKELVNGYGELGNGNVLAQPGMDAKRMGRYNHYIDTINYHIRGMENFLQEVRPVAEKSEDYILRANSGQYITDFFEIVEELNKYGDTVPVEVLEKLMPKIDKIDELHKKVEQQMEKIKEEREKKVAQGFFNGCDTIEKLEKRYKALCKTYHPDSEAGDEETFKKMKDEYEERKGMLKK